MRLSDLIRAVEHVKAKHGDIRVLQRRQVWYDSTELFPDGIDVDAMVALVARFARDGKHAHDRADRVPADAPDRAEFAALVLGQ